MDTQSEKNNVQKETEVAASGAKTHRKRNLVIVTLLFLIIAAGFALAYFLFGSMKKKRKMLMWPVIW